MEECSMVIKVQEDGKAWGPTQGRVLTFESDTEAVNFCTSLAVWENRAIRLSKKEFTEARVFYPPLQPPQQTELRERLESMLPDDFWDKVEKNLPNYGKRDDVAYSDDLQKYVDGEADEDCRQRVESSVSLHPELENTILNIKLYIEALEHDRTRKL